MGDVPKIPPEVAAAQAVLRVIAAKGRDQLHVEGHSDAAIDAEIAKAMTVMEGFLQRRAESALPVAKVHPGAPAAGSSKRRRARRGTAQH